MAVNIGPKIGIDGEAQFRKELGNIIQQAKTLESKMSAVTTSFDENTDSQEKLEAQAKVLNQQIEVQDKRVALLERGLRDAAKEFGQTSTQALKWEQALNEAKTATNNMKSQLSKMEDGVEDVSEELVDAAQASFDFGDAFKANLLSGTLIEGVKKLAGEIGNLVEDTKEYRKIMGTLSVSSEKAGYSAEQTAEIYKMLYGVLGDEQTAATTVANLQAIGLEQNKLKKITNAAVGAWASYGDSIPIDGLAESINETIRSGQVTGTFADVLNWAAKEGETFGVKLKKNIKANEEWNKSVQDAKTAEDFFNLALQDASSSTERANLVMKLFASQGLDRAGEAWQETNKDIVEANQATADFQEVTAKLAEKFSPVSLQMQKGFNKIARSASDLVDQSDIDEFTELIEDIADFIADDVLPVVKNLFRFVIDNKDYVISGFAGIGAAVATWKIAEGVKKVTDGIQKMTKGIEGATSATKLLSGVWKTSPAGLIATTIGLVTAAVGLLWRETDKGVNALEEANKAMGEAFNGMAQAASNFQNGMKSAESYLSDFDTALFASTEKQNQLKQNMQDVQKGITEICRRASNERRDYTKQEIVELDNLFTRLRELNQQQLEIEAQRAQAIGQQAITSAEAFNGSLEEYEEVSQRWIATAEEQRKKTLSIIEEQTINEIALLNQRYGEEANLSNNAYRKEYDEIIAWKEKNIQAAEDNAAKVAEAYSGGYLQQNNDLKAALEQMTELHKQEQSANEEHSKKLAEIERQYIAMRQQWVKDMGLTETVEDSKAKMESVIKASKEMVEENQRFSNEIATIRQELTGKLTEDTQKQLGVWLALQAQTVEYGGAISSENYKFAQAVLSAYHNLPESAQAEMADFEESILSFLQSSHIKAEAETGRTTDSIAAGYKELWSKTKPEFQSFHDLMLGALNALKTDTKKTAQDTGSDIVSGVISGINFKSPLLKNSAKSMANLALNTFRNALGIHSPSKEFEKIGKYSMEGYGIGFDKKASAVYQDIGRQFQNTAVTLRESARYIPSQAEQGKVYNNNAQFEIVINAAQGQNEDSIAQAVMNRIQNEVQKKGAVFR